MSVQRYKRDPGAEVRRALAGDKARAPKVADPAKPAGPEDGKRTRNTMRKMLDRSREKRRPNMDFGRANAEVIFKAYTPPPGVLPANTKPVLAMDSALQGWAQESYSGAWGFANPAAFAFTEGVTFLGYAFLSELTQRPEYRRISERIATEMTRKWIRLTIAGDDEPEDEDKDGDDLSDKQASKLKKLLGQDASRDPKPEEDEPDQDNDLSDEDDGEGEVDDVERDADTKRKNKQRSKVKKIEEAMREFGIRDVFRKVAEYDGWFGRGHVYIDTGDGDKPEELTKPIGNGFDELSKGKIKKGSIKGFKAIEPIWCYPAFYNANDPLAPDWYNPSQWYVMAKQMHASRLLTFVGREVPDILKPAYSFGGLSMSQMAKPYIDNWLRTRQAVTDLVVSFSVSGVYTDMYSVDQIGGGDVFDRIDVFNNTRSNRGAFLLDKETEEFFNVTTPLSGLDALQAQSQEQMSSVSGIPLIVLLGITPTGLNASSEGELRVFYDWIHAFQESFFRGKLKRVIDMIQLHLFGEVDDSISFEFEPLWSLDEKAQAEVEKVKMETHNGYVDMGAIGNEEVRAIIVNDDALPYTNLNPADVPDLKEEEEDGLVPGKAGGGKGGMGSGNDNEEVEGAADALPIEIAAGSAVSWDDLRAVQGQEPTADQDESDAGDED